MTAAKRKAERLAGDDRLLGRTMEKLVRKADSRIGGRLRKALSKAKKERGGTRRRYGSDDAEYARRRRRCTICGAALCEAHNRCHSCELSRTRSGYSYVWP